MSLDLEDAERRFQRDIIDPTTAEDLFDRQWAVALTTAAANCLAEECEKQGKANNHRVLSCFLAGAPDHSSYETAGRELGISAATARVATSRMRSRYRDLLRLEIAATVADETEIDDEIRDLFKVFNAH